MWCCRRRRTVLEWDVDDEFIGVDVTCDDDEEEKSDPPLQTHPEEDAPLNKESPAQADWLTGCLFPHPPQPIIDKDEENEESSFFEEEDEEEELSESTTTTDSSSSSSQEEDDDHIKQFPHFQLHLTTFALSNQHREANRQMAEQFKLHLYTTGQYPTLEDVLTDIPDDWLTDATHVIVTLTRNDWRRVRLCYDLNRPEAVIGHDRMFSDPRTRAQLVHVVIRDTDGTHTLDFTDKLRCFTWGDSLADIFEYPDDWLWLFHTIHQKFPQCEAGLYLYRTDHNLESSEEEYDDGEPEPTIVWRAIVGLPVHVLEDWTPLRGTLEDFFLEDDEE